MDFFVGCTIAISIVSIPVITTLMTRLKRAREEIEALTKTAEFRRTEITKLEVRLIEALTVGLKEDLLRQTDVAVEREIRHQRERSFTKSDPSDRMVKSRQPKIVDAYRLGAHRHDTPAAAPMPSTTSDNFLPGMMVGMVLAGSGKSEHHATERAPAPDTSTPDTSTSSGSDSGSSSYDSGSSGSSSTDSGGGGGGSSD